MIFINLFIKSSFTATIPLCKPWQQPSTGLMRQITFQRFMGRNPVSPPPPFANKTKKTFPLQPSTDNYFEPSGETLQDNFHHAPAKTDDGNGARDADGVRRREAKSHKVFLSATHSPFHTRSSGGKTLMWKSFSLCGNLLFTLFSFGELRHHTRLLYQLPTHAVVKGEKQIEKRDCFEIHGASQVPTVPFGFSHSSSPLRASPQSSVVCSPVIC